jgi:DNA-binding CsgD family transcriptional regulator
MRSHGRRQEVWAKALWIVMDIAEQGGIDLDPLFEGLPFDAVSARSLRRVAWDDYRVFGDRVEDAAGGPEALAALCQNAFHRITPELRMIAGSVISPKALLRLMVQVFNPLVLPTLDWEYEDRGDHRVRIEIAARPGVRIGRSFHSASLGIIRGMPQHLDLPPAKVVSTRSDDHLIFDAELPSSRTILARTREASNAVMTRVWSSLVLGYDEDGAPIGAVTPPPAEDRMTRCRRDWSLTRRQTEVLEILVRGKSNKEIASSLACAENTVELHITQLLRRASVSSRAELIARYWSEAS